MLGDQQLLQSIGKPAYDGRAEHAGQLHERALPVCRYGIGREVVRGRKESRDLVVGGRLYVGQSGAIDEWPSSFGVGGENDIPVPPLLVIARSRGIDATLAVCLGKFVVHDSHNNATSCSKVQTPSASWQRAR